MNLRRAAAWTGALALLGALTAVTIATISAARTTQLPVWSPTRSGTRLTDPTGGNIPHPIDGHAPPRTQHLDFRVHVSRTITFGMARLRPFQNYMPAAPPPVNPSPESVARRWERALLLPWLDGHRPWPDPTKGESVWVKASGWPLRCLVCYPRAVNAPNFVSHSWVVRGGLIVGNNSFPSWADWPPKFPRILPFTPIWPEFLADAAIYSAVWATLLLSLTVTIRALRTRHGHCRRCNYSLAGLPARAVCPECGAPAGTLVTCDAASDSSAPS